MSRHQNAAQDRNIKIANKSVENVAEFKYLEQQQHVAITFVMELEQSNFGECLLPFSSESFIFPPLN
jgi:hypothetical protein